MSQQNPSSVAEHIDDKALSTDEAIEFMASEESDDKESEIIELEKDSKKSGKVSDSGKDKDAEEGEEHKDEEEKSLEDELEKELEEDEKEVDEEALDLAPTVRRKEVLAKYPNVFKDFPGLERALYREKGYSEVFSTIEDARNAKERGEILDEFETDLMSGSTENILKAIRDNDKDAFVKVVDNYLPNLYKTDEAAYYHVIGNIVKHTIVNMVTDGREAESQELIDAAKVVNQYVFGTKQFTHPSRLSKDGPKEENPKEAEINERERALIENQFNSAKDSVVGDLDKTINKTIDKYIDPRDSMSGYVKKNATREVGELLESTLQKDRRFMDVYDRLWERALDNNFDAQSMDRIKNAYLSKAKTVLPMIIKSVRNEALKSSSNRSEEDNRDRKGPLPVGKTRGSAPSSKSKSLSEQAKSIPRGTSTLDFLNSD